MPTWGWAIRKHFVWFLGSMSAASLLTVAMWVALISMSNSAVKNQRQRRRYIAVVSFAKPLLITVTRIILSHWNSALFHVKEGPQMAQLMTFGTNSFAMMLTVDHSAGQGSWNHWLLKRAPYPHSPDASVWIWQSKVSWCWARHKKLRPFQLLIKLYHQCKADWKFLLRQVKWWSF